MKALSSRVLYKASPVMLAVALGLLGPAALNDEEDDAHIEAGFDDAQDEALPADVSAPGDVG